MIIKYPILEQQRTSTFDPLITHPPPNIHDLENPFEKQEGKLID